MILGCPFLLRIFCGSICPPLFLNLLVHVFEHIEILGVCTFSSQWMKKKKNLISFVTLGGDKYY